MITVGLGLLRLSPADFWSLTPREFDRAARAVLGETGEAPSHAEIERLMKLYPD